ncbi:MAG: tRNA lysidine(34) synthetase TilS, partial [Armatimonadetes bacterium]|nr:tRNA lysidine(34) synthetase TilS [Armatimonadota bacterium]
PGPKVALARADLAEGLIVRGWQDGDRFFPLGAPGRKKLQDFFVDAKVPREQRRQVPLVIHPREGIIWVAGMRLSQAARVEAGAQKVVVLRLENLHGAQQQADGTKT